MDQLVEDRNVLFKDVQTHLTKVRDNPETTLDEELLRRASRNADTRLPRATLWQLLNTGETTLQTLQQDPRPLTKLLEQVVLALPFEELKDTITPAKLEDGLKSPVPAIQLLILSYLHKAADLPSGAAFVAASPSLSEVLITTWLATESTEVSDRALDTIVALLDVDSPNTSTYIVAQSASGEAHGQGLFWKRIFQDTQVYSSLFQWTSLTDSKHELTTKKGRDNATISQGRLFDFIARIAHIDWVQITTSTLPEIEKTYIKGNATAQPYGGILRYAATDMIDQKDYLMEVLRQDFFMKLLAVAEESNKKGVSPRLLTAIQQGAGVSEAQPSNGDGVHL